ncbi:MAG: carboxypeptidase-like regulatory domain-containing protein [Saprospiraceae bacterium]
MKSFQIKNLFLGLLLLLPMLTYAGEIFGTLKKDGKPLAKQEVKIVQAGKVIATATTDDKGYYSVVIKPIGKCTLELTGYEGATFNVFSTNNSSDYTLSVVKEGDKWLLKKQ